MVNKKIRQDVREYDKICRYCRSAPSNTVDHIIPYSQEGADAWSNLVGCCEKCNNLKDDLTLTAAYEKGLPRLKLPKRFFIYTEADPLMGRKPPDYPVRIGINRPKYRKLLKTKRRLRPIVKPTNWDKNIDIYTLTENKKPLRMSIIEYDKICRYCRRNKATSCRLFRGRGARYDSWATLIGICTHCSMTIDKCSPKPRPVLPTRFFIYRGACPLAPRQDLYQN